MMGITEMFRGKAFGVPKNNIEEEVLQYKPTPGEKVLDASFGKSGDNSISGFSSDRLNRMMYGGNKTDISNKLGTGKPKTNFENLVKNELGGKGGSSFSKMLGNTKMKKTNSDERLRSMLGNSNKNANSKLMSMLGNTNSNANSKLMSMLGTPSGNAADKITGFLVSPSRNAAKGSVGYAAMMPKEKINNILNKIQPNLNHRATEKILGENKLRAMLGNKTSAVNTRIAGDVKLRSYLSNPTKVAAKLEMMSFGGKKMPMFGDYDKDGIVNIRDCNPLDRRKQGTGDEAEEEYFDMDNLAGNKFETYGKEQLETYSPAKEAKPKMERYGEELQTYGYRTETYGNAEQQAEAAIPKTEVYGKKEPRDWADVIVVNPEKAVSTKKKGFFGKAVENINQAKDEALRYYSPRELIKRKIESDKQLKKAEEEGRVQGRLDFATAQAAIRAGKQASLATPPRTLAQLAFLSGVPSRMRDQELGKYYSYDLLFGKKIPREVKASLWESLSPNVSSGRYFGTNYINPQSRMPMQSEGGAIGQIRAMAGQSGGSGGIQKLRDATRSSGNGSDMDRLYNYLKPSSGGMSYSSRVEEAIGRGVQMPEQQIVSMEQRSMPRDDMALQMSRQLASVQEAPQYQEASQPQNVAYVPPTPEGRLYSPYSRRYVSVVRGPYKKTYGYTPQQQNAAAMQQ